MALSSSILNMITKPAKLLVVFSMLAFVTGCQTGKSPEEVTHMFWKSLAQGQLEAAKKYVTTDSQHLVNIIDIEKNSTIQTGDAYIDDDLDTPFASVSTTIIRNKKPVTFNTMLTKESNDWKIDYVQTQLNITMIPLGDIAKSLQNLGGVFAKQLEQQLPLIQREMESFGNQLKQKLDELGRSLEKPQSPANPAQPRPGSI